MSPHKYHMRDLIILVESLTLDPFVELAKRHDTVEAFIRATDGMDVLYRGQSDDDVPDNCFMTDWVEHAGGYSDGPEGIYAFAYDHQDVFLFNNQRFDDFRSVYRRLSDEDLAATYRDSLQGNRFAANLQNDLRVVRAILNSYVPYNKISGNPRRNDMIVPLLQKYASEKHGKNIIAFWGNDFADYGGHIEYVVGQISKLTDLRKLWSEVHGQL